MLIQNYGNKLDINSLFDSTDHLRLCCGEYSNYVMQDIVSGFKWYSTEPQFVSFREKLCVLLFNQSRVVDLSSNLHASHVLDECIVACSSEKRRMFVNALTRNKCRKFKEISNDDGGCTKKVVNRLYNHCSGENLRKLRVWIGQCEKSELGSIWAKRFRDRCREGQF